MPIDKAIRNKTMDEAAKSVKKKRLTFQQGMFNRLKKMGRAGLPEEQLKALTPDEQKFKLENK